LSEFCKVHRVTEDIKREMKMQSKQLSDIKKTGIQELTEMLQESKNSVYRVDPPAQYNGDDFPAFVRLKRTASSKTLTPELLETAINNITMAIVSELAEREAEKPRARKRRKTSAAAAAAAAGGEEASSSTLQIENLVANAVLQVIKKARCIEKQTAELTSKLPRGVDESKIGEAPPDIQRYVQEIYSLQHKVKEVNKRYKEELQALQHREEEVRQEVDNFLKRGNKDSFKLNVNVDGDRVHYYIRRRTEVSKKPMSATELKDHVFTTVGQLFQQSTHIQNVQDVNDSFLSALRQSVYTTLLHHLKNREKTVQEKIVLHRGRGQAHNVQVYESSDQSEQEEEE